MDLVDEQHIARLQIGEDRRQIAGPRQHRPACHPKTDAQLARHDLRKGGFSQARRAMKKRVVHRLAPDLGTFDENPQVCARIRLADKLFKRLRPQRAVHIFRQLSGAQGRVRQAQFRFNPFSRVSSR